MHIDDAMPHQPHLNETFLRVMLDHDVTQAQLAAALGADRSTIGRMTAGTIAVSLEAAIVLFGLTRDTRLLNVLDPDGRILMLDTAGADLPGQRTDVDVATLLIALGGVQSEALRDGGLRESARTTAAIDTAIAHLIRARVRVTRGEPVPFQYRQARRLPDPLSA